MKNEIKIEELEEASRLPNNRKAPGADTIMEL
jgi:hypothetical protein